MDKVIINNQIVLMRKFVKQAKIRCINKYTKEIRLLQNRKGNDDETAKHKRKAERLLSKVAILRKIKPDTISRKALSKEKEWKDVLKEKNIPLEDQCYAMLANYGPVQSEVEKFHKKHWDVVPKISDLFKSWEEKSKNPMLKQERKKAKELRKSLKAANVKLGKNNSNAAPIGPKIKDNMETESSLTTDEKEKNSDVLNEVSDDTNEEFSNKHIQNDTTSLSLLNVSTGEEDNNSENEKIEETKNILRKSPIKKCLKNKSKVAAKKTANKEEFEDSQLKQIANSDPEEYDSESEANSLDNDSENDIEEEESITEGQESDMESGKVENFEDTKEPIKLNKVVMKQKPNLKSPKPVSQHVKPKSVAGVSQKTNTYEKRKSSFKEKVASPKKPEANSLKAVTMLNLNELEGLDEFPIENTDSITEETGEKKRRRDPFFLGKGGEVVSESENEDSDNPGQEKDDQNFKQRKFNNFERKSSDGQDFKQRKFNNFERKSSDGQDFKRKKFNNFERKSFDGDIFKKRNFSEDSSPNRRPGFRDNGFQRNRRNANFEDKSNSFQNRGKPSFEFQDKGFKSMSKDQFKNKREKSFHDRPSERKQNFHQELNNKPQFQKNKLSSPIKKNSGDDKPLHPSWEAKKKLKESATAKFQGKRTVFGD